MKTFLSVIFAAFKLANSPDGALIIGAMSSVFYDLLRRYCKTSRPSGFLWDLHRVLRWISELSGNAAAAMDPILGQAVKNEGIRIEERKP